MRKLEFHWIDWLIFIAVPLLAWVLGRIGRPAKVGTRAYYLANQNLNSAGLFSTYFGANLTFTAIFLILSQQAYQKGGIVFCVPVFWALGSILFAGFYKRLRPFFQRGMTLHQSLAEGFNSRSLQKCASAWTILAFLGTVALEFFGVIKLMQWIGLPPALSLSIAMVLAMICSAFTITGGFRGVAFADGLLDLAAFAATVILFLYCIGFSAPSLVTQVPIPELPGKDEKFIFALAMALIFLPFQFCTFDSWQRCGAWEKNHKSPKLIAIFGIFLALCYCVPIWIGLVLRREGVGADMGAHPIQSFLTLSGVPMVLLGLVFAGFVGAALSTADELLNCCSYSLLFDCFQVPRLIDDTQPEIDAKLVNSGKFYTAVFGFGAAAIALLGIYYEREITDMAIAVFSVQVVFTIPLAVMVFFPSIAAKGGRAAIASTFVGFLSAVITVCFGWAANDSDLSDGAPIVGFILALVGFFGFYLAARIPKRQPSVTEYD